jgi:hypothetical protein
MTEDTAGSSARWLLLMAIGALVVVGLFLRVWGLWDFSLSPDEALTLLISSEPTISEVLDFGAQHPHPPLRYILLHFMLYISDGVLFLKSIAYLPGVALVPVFFLLGRRTAGTASGITMATLATFSYAGLLLSEVLRTYMLGTFFISVGLCAFFAYIQEERTRYLYIYSASMTLGLLSHYFTILPVAAVCLVWLCRIVRSQRPLSKLIGAALANLPVAIVALASYVLHISSRYSEAHWNSITGGWLAPHFPGTVSEFLANAVALFAYLYLEPNKLWIMVLAALGIVALWVTKRRDVAMVIILTITVNLVLTFVHKYPFGGVRQCVYLLPLFSVAVGAAVQFGCQRTLTLFERWFDPGLLQWASSRRKTLSYVALACFIVFLAGVSYGIIRLGNLRRYDGNGWVELPVKRDDMTGALRYVREHMEADDIVLAERQTMLYAQLATRRDPEATSEINRRLSLGGLELHGSDGNFTFHSEEVLWTSFEDLLRHVEIGEDTTIWVVSIGWQSIKRVLAGEIYEYLVIDSWSRGGAGVYGFRGSAVADEIERRFGDGTADLSHDGRTSR